MKAAACTTQSDSNLKKWGMTLMDGYLVEEARDIYRRIPTNTDAIPHKFKNVARHQVVSGYFVVKLI